MKPKQEPAPRLRPTHTITIFRNTCRCNYCGFTVKALVVITQGYEDCDVGICEQCVKEIAATFEAKKSSIEAVVNAELAGINIA